MIKLLFILIFLATGIFAQDKIYKVAFLKDWKPYYKINKDGNLDGYVFELFEAIRKKTNLKFEYKVVNNWKEILTLLEKGQIDIVPNVGITKTREHLFVFTQPTDTFKIKLYKRIDSPDIKSFKDIKDKTVGVKITNICDQLITKNITNKKIVLNNFNRLLTSLTSGEVDIICYPEVLMNLKIKNMGLEKELIPFGNSLKEIKRGIGVSKENFELLPILDEAIAEIKIDGTFQEIYMKWFSKKESSKISQETFEKIMIIGLILFLILVFVIYWNNKLKEEYAKQKELESKLESAQKIAKIGYYTYNFKDESFSCSSEIDKIFGLDEDSIKNMELWQSCIHHDDVNKVIKDWEYSLKNNVDFCSEYRVINLKTKNEIWVSGLGNIIRDKNSNPISMFGIVQNIDERKRLEEKLSQAMMVFENTNDGIVITDKDTNILNVNKSFEVTTGYKLEDIINNKPNILRSDENDDKFYAKMWKDLNELGVWRGEIINKKKNNTTYYEILTINTIYNMNKEVSGYIGIFSDITQHKIDEKIMFNQAKVAAVGEMLGNISHQWRQPLSVISTHATGLKVAIEFDNEKLSDEKLIESMDKINEQTQYLSKTIDDFRSFFKGDTNDIHTFNIKTAFKRLKQLTKDTLNNNYIKSEFSIIDIELTRNDNLLIQALINIFNNAKDAMVENVKNTDDRFLLVETKVQKQALEIIIQDTGGGIPIDIIEKVFDPYFTTKHESIGTGIGLYMTHQIISKQFEGTLVASNIDIHKNKKTLKGSEFKLILPLDD